MGRHWAWIAGAALGAGGVYFLDTKAGRARRAKWREALLFTIRKVDMVAFATPHRHGQAERLTKGSPHVSPSNN